MVSYNCALDMSLPPWLSPSTAQVAWRRCPGYLVLAHHFTTVRWIYLCGHAPWTAARYPRIRCARGCPTCSRARIARTEGTRGRKLIGEHERSLLMQRVPPRNVDLALPHEPTPERRG